MFRVQTTKCEVIKFSESKKKWTRNAGHDNYILPVSVFNCLIFDVLQLTPNVIIINGEGSTTSRPTAENLSNTLTGRALTNATLSILAIVLYCFAVRPLASVTRLSRDYANQRSTTVTLVISHAR